MVVVLWVMDVGWINISGNLAVNSPRISVFRSISSKMMNETSVKRDANKISLKGHQLTMQLLNFSMKCIMHLSKYRRQIVFPVSCHSRQVWVNNSNFGIGWSGNWIVTTVNRLMWITLTMLIFACATICVLYSVTLWVIRSS